MTEDLYQTLGVARGASEDDIKKAFKKLAKKCHPDLHPGDAAAERKFKQISAAYDVLSDAKKRSLYDEFGADALRAGFDEQQARQWRQFGGSGGFGGAGGFGGFQGFGDFGDVDLSDLLGGLGGRRRGRDLEGSIEVDLTEVVKGSTRPVTVGDDTIRVRIPPGVGVGQTIRVPGRGRPGPRGGQAGDLLLKVSYKAHPWFRVDGQDVTVDLPVTLGEITLGASVEVPTLDGRVKVKIAPNSAAGRKLRLPGKGLPDARTGRTGDLYAVLRVQAPAVDATDPAVRAAIELIERHYGDVRAAFAEGPTA